LAVLFGGFKIMNKCILAFIISHLKWAIYNLECVNKLEENTVDSATITELKILLKKVSEN
jgi:hypothetical protein